MTEVHRNLVFFDEKNRSMTYGRVHTVLKGRGNISAHLMKFYNKRRRRNGHK